MRKRTRYRTVYINGNTEETEKQYTQIKVPIREKRKRYTVKNNTNKKNFGEK